MMKRKLLIGTIVVLGIAAAILQPMLLGVVLIGVWIYLVFMVRKKKTKIFHDQVEPKLAERRLKRLNIFLLVAGISGAAFIMFMVGVVLYHVIWGLPETESAVGFFIGYSLLVVFIIASGGGLLIFLKGRQKPP